MNKHLPNAIGGYFELELPLQLKRLYPDAIRFQSARASFYALLMEGKPSRVWMPTYICDSMLAPLIATKTEIVFYGIESDLGVSKDVQIHDGDWFLYVNYFGVCAIQEDRLLERFSSSQIIFDKSQAFFSPPRDCLATIYSPRKFFGVPDGGLLLTSLSVIEPDEIETGSVGRCAHLLKRLDDTPEAAYQDFKNAEETFSDMRPRKMSLLTNRILDGIEYDACRKQRNSNFHFLHDHLGNINDLKLDLSRIDGPMCYPLLNIDTNIRERLLANRIFVPTYWPELRNSSNINQVERCFVKDVVCLPIDQRYGQKEMTIIIDCVRKL